MGCSVVVGGPDWLGDQRGPLQSRLREVAPDALPSLRATVPHRSIEISTFALGVVVDGAFSAKRALEFPVLRAAHYSGVLFAPRLEERPGRWFPIPLGLDGLYQLFPLERAVGEAQAALGLLGLNAPLDEAYFKQSGAPGYRNTRESARSLAPHSDLGDARLLLSALIRWGAEAIEHGSCVWFVK